MSADHASFLALSFPLYVIRTKTHRSTGRYLQCRMEHNLMEKEEMSRLGFLDSDNEAKPPRKVKKQTKEMTGFKVGQNIDEARSRRARALTSAL